jgi:hypothetical protein
MSVLVCLIRGAMGLGWAAESPTSDTLPVGMIRITLEAPQSASSDVVSSNTQTNQVSSSDTTRQIVVPEGTILLSRKNQHLISSALPVQGTLAQLTDLIKDSRPENLVKLPIGLQYVQIDLIEPVRIHAIVLWHDYSTTCTYHDVIVQLSDDADFSNPRTVYNNDQDGSSGLGTGSDAPYVETPHGNLIVLDGPMARFIRFYSAGSDINSDNRYVETEIYGIPSL